MELFIRNSGFMKIAASLFILSVFGVNVFAFQTSENSDLSNFMIDGVGDCGQFRTQTQGGWGTSGAGDNPGAYRDANFDDAFPNGLSIGCDYTLTLTSSAAVQDFLPSGSTASALTENLIDPTSYSNVLAGQIVALRLSIGFDEYDADFSESTGNLGDMIISSGTFMDWSVYSILQEANDFIGACSSNYTASELNDVLSSINENYVDGTMDNGFLECPDDVIEDLYCFIELESTNAYCNEDDTYTLEISIIGNNATYIVEDANALTGSGGSICLGDSSDENALVAYTFVLTYETSSSYAASISALIPALDGCSEAINSDDCSLNDISGIPPVCCAFAITCPVQTQFVYSCLEDLPSADTSLIEFVNNCGPVTITVSESIQGQGCQSNPYNITRTYTISDGSTILYCTFNYLVIDSTPPVITCPSEESADCSATEVIPQEWATAVDNCDSDVDISYVDEMSGSCDSFTRIWTATDDCGNTASCSQTVLITDLTAPILNLPPDATVDCGSETIPAITGTATATDVCSSVIVTYSDGDWSGDDCFASFVRTWTATDACGNSKSGEQTINKEDNEGPMLFGIPGNSAMDCGEIPGAPLVSAYDVCQGDSVEVVLVESIFGVGCQQIVMRNWTATDSCGNATSITRVININDNTGPIITCPDSVILNCGDAVPDPGEAGLATAEDNCSGTDVTITHQDSPLNNDCPPSIHRIWTAVDTCGNSSSCVQVISFIDTEAPVVECVDDITVDCSYGDTSPLFTGTPNVLEDCSNVDLNYSDGPYSGDCPVSFTRTWTASDACGNATICEQVITINDQTGPIVFCPSFTTVECGGSIAPEQTGMAVAIDNCLSVELTYEDGELSGECPQSFIRTWIASDYCGNTTICEQTIEIEDNTAPLMSCPDEISIDCSIDNIDETVTGIPVVSDGCGSVTLNYTDSPIEGNCPQYFYRIWIAIDNCGNMSQCSQLVNIIDDAAPELICPTDITIPCEGSSDPVYTGYAIANADCSEIEITYTDSIVLNESSTSNACGQFRTQTQGGWGSGASGDNPGSYRDAHFDEAFPNGLTIGCDYTLTLTSSQAVENFLPAGGSPYVLLIDMVDPFGFGNTLAAQLVAISLSIGFDNNDAGFADADGSLSQLMIANGIFAGMTIAEVVQEANNFIGQCGSQYSANELNEVLSRINENYVDGRIDNGFLFCDEGIESCSEIYRTWTAIDECGNTSTCTQVITGTNGFIDQNRTFDAITINAYPSPTLGEVTLTSNKALDEGDLIEVFDVSGVSMIKAYVDGSEEQKLDLSMLESGIYIIKWYGNAGSSSIRVVKN